MSRTMYDGVTAANLPADAKMVGGYIDGRYRWTEWDWARFPDAVHVRIACFASTDDGDVLDIEPGCAEPADAPGWLERRRAAKAWPSLYVNLANWDETRQAVSAAGLIEPPWWVAHYTGLAHIQSGSVATQYSDPGPYDVSEVADYWPGVDPIPSSEEETMLPKIVDDPVSGGSWLVTSDGGVQNFAGAPFPGSLPGHPDWHAGGGADVNGPAVDAAWYAVPAGTKDDAKRGLVIVTLDSSGVAHPYFLSRDGAYAPHPSA